MAACLCARLLCSDKCTTYHSDFKSIIRRIARVAILHRTGASVSVRNAWSLHRAAQPPRGCQPIPQEHCAAHDLSKIQVDTAVEKVGVLQVNVEKRLVRSVEKGNG